MDHLPDDEEQGSDGRAGCLLAAKFTDYRGERRDVVGRACDRPTAQLQGILPPSCAGLRLDAALARLFTTHSRSRLARWLAAGRVWVDGAPAGDGRRKVAGGERIEIEPDDGVRTPNDQAEAIPLSIVYEDESLIVIDKPAGLVVHPGNGHEGGTLMNALVHHAPELVRLERAGIVHRLDKDTTGLLVVARTAEAQTALSRQLAARSVTRLYRALVHGAIAQGGLIDAPLGRHPVQRTKIAIVRGGREARTHYRPLEHFNAATLLECKLDTGRTHQIRVHLASIGHPLVGDATYGRRQAADVLLAAFPRQALHACTLSLIHPARGTPMSWQSPLPADFSALLAVLRDDRLS